MSRVVQNVVGVVLNEAVVIQNVGSRTKCLDSDKILCVRQSLGSHAKTWGVKQNVRSQKKCGESDKMWGVGQNVGSQSFSKSVNCRNHSGVSDKL